MNYGEIQDIFDKAEKVLQDIKSHESLYIKAEMEYQEEKRKLGILLNNLNTMEEGYKLMMVLIQKFSQQQIDAVRDLLNVAVTSIFFNRNYEIKFDITDKRGVKNLDIMLLENKDGVLVECDIKDSVGGGVRAVIGLVLRIYFIKYFGLAPVLFLDESLIKISEVYISKVMDFLKKLSEEEGFIFTLVTHDNRVMAYADRMYIVNKGKVLLREAKE